MEHKKLSSLIDSNYLNGTFYYF